MVGNVQAQPHKEVKIIQVYSDKITDLHVYASEKLPADEFYYFDLLVSIESGWRPTAENPSSTASGLCQFLDSTYERYGGKTDDPYEQLEKCFDYIEDHYETPSGAISHHNIYNWY